MTRQRAACRCLLVVMLVAVATVATSGCWDRRETNTLAIVVSSGLDSLDGKQILLTAEVSIPGAGGGGEAQGAGTSGAPQPTVIQAAGNDPFDALRAMGLKASRQPFLPHQRVIVFGRSLAEQGVSNVLDFYVREPEARETAWLLVSSDSAASVISAREYVAGRTAVGLDALLMLQSRTPEAVTVDLEEFVEMQMGDAHAAYAPMVQVEKCPQGTQATALNGTAVFLDGKMVGVLNRAETKGLLWVKGKTAGSSLMVADPTGSPLATLGIRGVRVTIAARLDGMKPTVDISIDAETRLASLDRALPLLEAPTFDDLEAAAAKALESEISATVAAAKRLRADIFGFADAFHRSHRHEWRQFADRWPDEFASLTINVSTRVHIRRTGLIISQPGG